MKCLRTKYLLGVLALTATLCFPIAARSTGPNNLDSHLATIIVLEAPRFEIFDLGSGHQIPLALPTVRIGTGLVVSSTCQVITSNIFLQNALAIAVRVPITQADGTIKLDRRAAARARESPSADLALLTLEPGIACNPYSMEKPPQDLVLGQKIVKVGKGGHQENFSKYLTRKPTVVSNPEFYRGQRESKVVQIDSQTSAGEVGSIVIDDKTGQFVGMVADDLHPSNEGFVVPAQHLVDFWEQAQITNIRADDFKDYFQDVGSVNLVDLADSLAESQKLNTDDLRRYFFNTKQQSALTEAFKKPEFLRRPAIAIVSAMTWNPAAFQASFRRSGNARSILRDVGDYSREDARN